MRHCDVRSADDALAYLTDCTLATVASMALKRTRPAGEYRRQISIAQSGVDWMRSFGVREEGTRVAGITGTVAEWAKSFEP